jgi:uncharacterized protein (TIGR03083 family)
VADHVVEQVIAEWDALGLLLDELAPAEWDVPTALPGWTVKDCVSHIIGSERMMMGDPFPERDVSGLPHVRNPFGEVVELWVDERRDWSPADVHVEFIEQTARRTPQLRAMTDDELNEVEETPLGAMTRRDFLEVRVFDSWMHEQDIRRAVGRSGHLQGPVVDIALDRIRKALGYVVGKKAGAPDGSTVVFSLRDGPAIDIAVRVEGRARVVDDVPDAPTVRITLPFETFVALGGGRWTATEAHSAGLTIDGDCDLADRVLESMAFTP